MTEPLQSGSPAPPELAATGLTVRFGTLTALDGVSLAVRAGECVAIAGENGSGKTTLIRALGGDLAPDSGTVELEGVALAPDPVAAARRGMRIVWQDLVLADNLDIAANVMLGNERRRHLLFPALLHADAARLLDRLGIPVGDPARPVRSLSGGQRRMIAVARAMARAPRVLLLDEPTSALGVAEAALVERLITRLRAEGTTIVVSGHDVPQMVRLADRILVLRHGRLVAEADPGDVHPDDVAALISGQALEEVRARREALEAALSAQEETMALRRARDMQHAFLRRLSHELRTPLTAITGYATSLLQPDVTWDDETRHRFLSRIAAESSRLGRLVNDLLDFSAIEAGIFRLSCDWCDLPLVIDAAVSVLPPERAPMVEVRAPSDLPAVWADHDRLEQVFVNLLANALEHNPPGTRVQVSADPGEDTVTLLVSDDGGGLDPELLRDPPSAGQSRPRGAGAGLGLSIARGIVAAHGGTLELEPVPRGTCLRITLPVEKAAEQEQA
ncbi:MAG: ATP-binding cassette domain-containing protein [Streptosporangiales bacterium]|nr:ATP-binding cassette domain-containing protein [Streptosporangiales bacterium]